MSVVLSALVAVSVLLFDLYCLRLRLWRGTERVDGVRRRTARRVLDLVGDMVEIV